MSVRTSAALLFLVFASSVAVLASDFADLVSESSPDGQTDRPSFTQAEVETVADAIASEDPLTSREQYIVDRFTQMLRDRLSPASLSALQKLQDAVYQLHEPGTSVNDLVASIVEHSIVETEQLLSESMEILSTLPAGKRVGAGRRSKGADTTTAGITLFWPFIGGVILCDLAVNACLRDVEQEWEDCMMGVLCSDLSFPSPICCDQKAQNDIFNCVISCGANRADGDYGRCCVRR